MNWHTSFPFTRKRVGVLASIDKKYLQWEICFHVIGGKTETFWLETNDLAQNLSIGKEYYFEVKRGRVTVITTPIKISFVATILQIDLRLQLICFRRKWYLFPCWKQCSTTALDYAQSLTSGDKVNIVLANKIAITSISSTY